METRTAQRDVCGKVANNPDMRLSHNLAIASNILPTMNFAPLFLVDAAQ
ncbi:MAG: hypothetical protein U1A72_13390 [Sulfuritalea sp.]|nr:hypothetical protein [Sulfuritalea sp.]